MLLLKCFLEVHLHLTADSQRSSKNAENCTRNTYLHSKCRKTALEMQKNCARNCRKTAPEMQKNCTWNAMLEMQKICTQNVGNLHLEYRKSATCRWNFNFLQLKVCILSLLQNLLPSESALMLNGPFWVCEASFNSIFRSEPWPLRSANSPSTDWCCSKTTGNCFPRETNTRNKN